MLAHINGADLQLCLKLDKPQTADNDSRAEAEGLQKKRDLWNFLQVISL
jgi:hypothetical protein